MNKIKLFWKENKKGYLWSCIAFAFMSLFLGLIAGKPISALSIGIFICFILMFIMAYGISAFTGGFKE